MNKGRWISFVCSLLFLCDCIGAEEEASAADEVPVPAGPNQQWRLIWGDEFETAQLDSTKWEVVEQKRRDAFWTAKAVKLDGKGHLVILVFREGERFYDACVRSRNRFERAFGYFEARVRFQRQPGHWTAFWMFHPSVTRVGDAGKDGTEIDIMEKPWIDDRVQHTLHWDGYGESHRSSGRVVEVPGVMDGFHRFGLLWRPDKYVFFVDGRPTWETDAGGVCQVPLYIKLSDEIEFNGWAGNIMFSKLPDEFIVDYVRVYDLVDVNSGESVWERARIEGITRYRGQSTSR